MFSMSALNRAAVPGLRNDRKSARGFPANRASVLPRGVSAALMMTQPSFVPTDQPSVIVS